MYARIANNNMEKALRLSDEGILVSRQDTLQFLTMSINEADLEFLQFSEEFRSTKSQHLLFRNYFPPYHLVSRFSLFGNGTRTNRKFR